MEQFSRFIAIIGLIAVMALSVPYISSCIPEAETVTATTTKTVTSTSATTVTSTSTEIVNNTVTSTYTKTETSVSTVTETVRLITVTDDAGITYTFEGPVDTIVSLAPSITEIVYFTGAGDKLIGRTDYCNYPEEASEVASIGGYYDPNKEKILLLNPDVVLADSIQCTTGDVEWFQSQGLTVIVIAPSDIEGVMRDIMLVGTLAGNQDFAAYAVAGLENRIDAVCNTLGGLGEAEKPSVLHITWYDPLWTVGKYSFLDIIIEMAGGINIFGDVEWDVQVDLEQAVIRNPDIITVVTDHGSEISFHSVIAEGSPFKETNAYLNGCIYIVDSDIVCRAGPRIVDALELYARLLHPELFS
ncbi:MAG: helical backbone metal receptor [Dehalococcoidales bacterium]|nr:helical backbone metal receptor [Dehalococcoidales bacterium]